MKSNIPLYIRRKEFQKKMHENSKIIIAKIIYDNIIDPLIKQQTNKIEVMKTERFLINIDKELTEILLGKTDDIKFFENKTTEEKLSFLKDIINRLYKYTENDPYLIVDKDNFNYEEKYNDVCLFLNRFNLAYTIYNTKEKEFDIFYGWHHLHGKIYLHFENEENGIYVSYYSEGHPKKEFKEKWEFYKTNFNNQNLLPKLEVTEKISDGKEVISEHFLQKNI